MVLARSWRPQGLVAAGLEVVYATTDPPLKAVRKVIPPLNLGSVRLDLGFMVLLIAVIILRNIAQNLALRALFCSGVQAVRAAWFTAARPRTSLLPPSAPR